MNKFKKPVLFGITLFFTLWFLSVSYAWYSDIFWTVNSSTTLSSATWNKLTSNVSELKSGLDNKWPLSSGNLAYGSWNVNVLWTYLQVYDTSWTRYWRMLHSASGNFHIDPIWWWQTYINWFWGSYVYIWNWAWALWTVQAASFSTSSDRRLKENIKTIVKPLDIVSRLRWVTFDWKTDKKEDVWFIAQEVEQVLPQLVDTPTVSSWESYKSVKYANITPVLVEAIKEQQKQIDELKKEINQLKSSK